MGTGNLCLRASEPQDSHLCLAQCRKAPCRKPVSSYRSIYEVRGQNNPTRTARCLQESSQAGVMKDHRELRVLLYHTRGSQEIQTPSISRAQNKTHNKLFEGQARKEICTQQQRSKVPRELQEKHPPYSHKEVTLERGWCSLVGNQEPTAMKTHWGEVPGHRGALALVGKERSPTGGRGALTHKTQRRLITEQEGTHTQDTEETACWWARGAHTTQIL